MTLAISETNDYPSPTIVLLGKREVKKTRLANVLLGKDENIDSDAFNSSAIKTTIKNGTFLGGGKIFTQIMALPGGGYKIDDKIRAHFYWLYFFMRKST